MTDDFDSWIEGGADPGITGDGDFSNWIEGGPVTPLSGDGATSLVIAESYHVHVADDPVLTCIHNLTVAEAYHLHEADGIEVTETAAVTLVVAEADHLNEADNISLTGVHDLAVAEVYHVHSADNIGLTSQTGLVVADAYHLHDVESISLTGTHDLAVQEAAHVTTADNLSLAGNINLVVSEAYHLHEADGLTIGTTWETDFSEYTTGVALSDWTERWNTGSVSNTVQAGSWENLIGKELFIDNNAASACLLSWDDLDGAADVDILALVKASESDEGFRIVARASGAAGSENGYHLHLTSGHLAIEKYVAGAETSLTNPYLYHEDNAYYWIRFHVEGTTLKGKVWGFDAFEPYDWALDTTDSSLSSGWCGLGGYAISDTYCYYFACGINGATPAAPSGYDGSKYFGPVTPMPATYSSINSTRAYGGIPTTGASFKITGARIYCGTTHTSQVRLAAYSGGDLASGPDGATLLVDFGLTAGSATGQWIEVSCDPVTVPAGTPLWLAVKGNDSGFNYPYSNRFAQAGSFQKDHGVFVSSAVSSDESVAFPATWPSDGWSTGSYWYGAQITLEIPAMSVDGSYHLHVTDNVVLTTQIDLSVNESAHVTASPELDIDEVFTLAVADGASEHAADNVTVECTSVLSPSDGESLHTADNIALTQAHTLSVAGSDHLHTADNIALSGMGDLGVDSCDHLHTADAVSLAVTPSVADTVHIVTSPELTLVSGFDLTVSDSDHLHVADPITGLTITINIAEGTHTHAADTLSLSGIHSLAVADSYHYHETDKLDIWSSGDLPVSSASHTVTSDTVRLGGSQTIEVRESGHATTADAVTLTQTHTLGMAGSHSYHLTMADNIVIAALPADIRKSWLDSLTVVLRIMSATERTYIDQYDTRRVA